MSWMQTEYEDLHRIVLPGDPPDHDMRSMVTDTEGARGLLRQNAFSWFDEGRCVAIAGISPMWKGVGAVWTLLTDESRERGVELSLGIYRMLQMLQRDRGYWRIQATVERGDEVARLWILRLKFRYEGTMVAYGPDGATHDMYARLVK